MSEAGLIEYGEIKNGFMPVVYHTTAGEVSVAFTPQLAIFHAFKLLCFYSQMKTGSIKNGITDGVAAELGMTIEKEKASWN